MLTVRRQFKYESLIRIRITRFKYESLGSNTNHRQSDVFFAGEFTNETHGTRSRLECPPFKTERLSLSDCHDLESVPKNYYDQETLETVTLD